mmetsp:Transcript_31646/g.56813  ORF Transcript_31646/g.56813 Transcript_31646/m.56813 type:complete len:826 (-) Transcript_31646:928-3405(-)
MVVHDGSLDEYGTFLCPPREGLRSRSVPVLQSRDHSSMPSDADPLLHWAQRSNTLNWVNLFRLGYLPSWQAWKFTTAEQRTMKEFDSSDLHPVVSYNYKRHLLRDTGPRLKTRKWFFMILLGTVLGLLAWFVRECLSLVMTMKTGLVEGISVDTKGLPPALGQMHILATLLVVNVGLAGLSSLLVVVLEPTAAGSGVPEVIATLNGIDVPGVFSARPLFVKLASLICAVCSGLPVGLQGPLIHIGAQVGHFIVMGYKDYLPAGHKVCSQKRRYEFICAGSACGVASAFNAPIGGLLLVMESMASWWDRKLLTLMIFCACLVTSLVLTVMWSVALWFQKGRDVGYFVPNYLQSTIHPFRFRVHIYEFVPTIIIGAAGGALSSLFIVLNTGVIRLRQRYINHSKWRQVLEVCCIAAAFTTFSVMLPKAFDCIPLGEDPEQAYQEQWVTALCDQPLHFNPMASLSLHSSLRAMSCLFSPKSATAFPPGVLLTFLVLYFSFAVVTAGSNISAGIVVPSMLMGAVVGRLFGLAFLTLLSTFGLEAKWLDPGVFAYLGAGACLAGMTRLSISLVVIMVELSGDTSQSFGLMVAVYVAVLVGNHFTHSLYKQLMYLKCIPILDDSGLVRRLHAFDVSKIMSTPVITVPPLLSVSRLGAVLDSCEHNAFPVTDPRGELLGMATRKQLLGIVANPIEYMNGMLPQHDESVHRKFQKLTNAVHLDDCQETDTTSDSLIDLTPWMDTSPFTVQWDFSLKHSADLFRNMGLRHLIILKGRAVVGIVTRRDLLPQVIERSQSQWMENVPKSNLHHNGGSQHSTPSSMELRTLPLGAFI